MYILKLPWFTHTEEHRKYEVYSVSLSPDGSRVATGGLDGKVKIWSTKDILRYRDDSLPQDAKCRPLCSMGRHTGAVTVVKFSPDGRFLATGSDDRVLLIWEKDDEIRPTFGEQENVEHWTVTKRVVAHDNDIQDMAWAPDSSILVTVGLDRSIIIWSGSTFEKIKRFDVHQSHVKGVVFDPANKYFATSSDDRSVRIFRYHKSPELSFSIERTVLGPFKKSPLTTYFRRLGWSPDGQHIAVPNATNGPVTSTAIINRGTWDSDISLIGHDSPCEIASFSPVLYESKPDVDNEPKVSCILATAGQDKNLVIWSTTSPKPIAVFEDVTLKTITDLCWTPDGLNLFVTSLDGTITVISFEDGELGKPISNNQNEEILNKYGVDKESIVFPESAEQLVLEDKALDFQKTLSDKLMDRLLRIEKPYSNRTTPPPVVAENNHTIQKTPIQPSVKTKVKTPTTKLNSVVVKNGKKRVAPTLISASSSSTHTSDKFKNITVTTKKVKDIKTVDKLSSTKYPLPKFGVQTVVNGYYVKKVNPDNEEGEDNEGDEIDDYEDFEEEEDILFPKRRKVKNYEAVLALQAINTITPLISKMVCSREGTSILEASNFEDEEDEEPTILRCQENGDIKFETFIQDRVVSVAGKYGAFWVIATDSNSLLSYSPSGRILYPRIELGCKVCFLSSHDYSVLAITEDYVVHTYDFSRFIKLHRKVSLAPILNYDQAIVDKKFQLSTRVMDLELRNNKIVAYLKNNDVFIYESDMKVWVKIIDHHYNQFNKYYNIWVDRLKNDFRSEKDQVEDVDPEVEFSSKLSFLETYQYALKALDDQNTEKVDQELQDLKESELYGKTRSDLKTSRIRSI